jgi:hypothetical protein
LENIVLEGRIKLKWILNKLNERAWADILWVRIGAIGDFLSKAMNLRLP